MANVETIEAQFPIRYLFRRRLTDSGGPGNIVAAPEARWRSLPTTRRTAASTMSFPAKARASRKSEGLGGGYPGGVNDYVWVHAPEEMHNVDRFAQSLDAIPGDPSRSLGRVPVDGLETRSTCGGTAAAALAIPSTGPGKCGPLTSMPG